MPRGSIPQRVTQDVSALVTGVTATPPLTSTGGTAPVIGFQEIGGVAPIATSGNTLTLGDTGAVDNIALNAFDTIVVTIANPGGNFSVVTDLGEIVRCDGNGFGLFGATPVPRPSVTGSRASGAALVSLLAALVALGAITDNTVA